MASLGRKLKKMHQDSDAAVAEELAKGAQKPKAANPRKRCGCGANLAGMNDKNAAQHVARCLGE